MKDRSHDDAMAEVFRKDPAYAAELLESILEDGNAGELLIALRQMAKAAVLTDDLRCWTPACRRFPTRLVELGELRVVRSDEPLQTRPGHR